MNSMVARLLLFSIVFLLPLIVAAQTDDSDDSVDLTAQDPETGEDLPTDGKASIEGTPGDGVRDKFRYQVSISPSMRRDPGRLTLLVELYDDDDESEYGYLGTDVIELDESEDGRAVAIAGLIDFSSDTELGQVLRYFGRVDFPSGRAATFEHDVTVGCQCPRAGSWTASNYPGSMVCTGIAGLTVPLAGNTQTGVLFVTNGCRTLNYHNFDDEYARVAMQRVPGECGYEGEAQGLPMQNSFNLDVQNEEFIIGSLSMELVQGGTTCIMARDFEVRFNE